MEPSSSGTSNDTLFVTRLELFNIMTNCENEAKDQFRVLLEKMKTKTRCWEEDHIRDLSKKLANFKSSIKYRWTKAERKRDRFLKNNKSWLESSISFKVYSEKKRGRPAVPFEICAERTKRLKTKSLREAIPVAELSYATQMSLKASGHKDAANILKEITNTTPTRASKYRISYKKSLSPKSKVMSGEDALAVFIDAKLSRHQYNIIRNSAPDRFPSYKIIQAAKKECYPEEIKATSTSVEVPLQELIDHTVKRLFQSETFDTSTFDNDDNLNICIKWGFDGSSGHSQYKQAFHGSQATDSSVFITSMVPLRLMYNDNIIWQNPRPGSTRYCRPLKMEFIKESTTVSLAEKKRVDDEIKCLQMTKLIMDEKSVAISHNLCFTMVDGKVCNALTDTSSTQKCYICGATSKQFNSIDEMIAREIVTENLKFGLSTLHGWIRFFECLLHLAYKLPLKKWQARGDDKQIVLNNKLRIQKEFKEKCGLIIDKPKPGFGNSNDGNTARRFFKNAKISSDITRIDINLIKKMHTILIVVSSGHQVNVEKFREYSIHTARYFVEKYPWYNMPPTLHKFFIHGPNIIETALVPIGQLTEEAQEARNKDFKKYREHFSRKCSRKQSNLDVFHLLLVSSDPVISSKRKLPVKKQQRIPKEARELLHLPDILQEDNSESESEEDCSESDKS